MRLIDADALHDLLERQKEILYSTNRYTDGSPIGLSMAQMSISVAPTVDAVVLPCKPGTTVYEIHNNTDACLDCDHWLPACCGEEECEHPEHKAEYPSLADSPVCEKHFMEIISRPTDEKYLFNIREKFGKTIFLTSAEAEAAIAEMNEGNATTATNKEETK